MGGGGYNVYPQLVHTSNKNKRAKASLRAQKLGAKCTQNGKKIKYNGQTATAQIVTWLLAFWVFAVFALCPLARLSTRYNLSAADTVIKSNTFYTNAPAYIAGDTFRGTGDSVNGSSISSKYGTVLNTGTMPSLFTTGGDVDLSVLLDLLEMINSESCTKTTSSTDGTNTYYSAKSFGAYTPTSTDEIEYKSNTDAQILVKLFETVSCDTDGYIDDFTSQYWQAVYRSTNSSADVLTLYMVRPYMNYTSSSSYGDYSNNTTRTEIYNDYSTLSSNGYFETQFTKYIVAPYQLSSSTGKEFSTSGYDTTGKNANLTSKTDFLNLGGWQSSEYQTSYNSGKTNYYNSKTSASDALGSSGYGAGSSSYNLENGLDGLSVPYYNGRWSTIKTVYTDKLWLPSAYEALHTGYASNSDSVKVETVNESATGRKIENGKYYDEANAVVYLTSCTTKDGESSNSNNNGNRTGLWELSGYDRASNSWTWLRSGYSDYSSAARAIGESGNYSGDGVDAYGGVRVALHLSLTPLANAICKVSLEESESSANATKTAFCNSESNEIKPYIFNLSNTNTKNKTMNVVLTFDKEVQIESIALSSQDESSAETIAECKYSDATKMSDGSYQLTLNISNVADDVNNLVITYTAKEVKKVTLTFDFANVSSQSQMGLIVYVVRADANGAYAEFYTMYVKREDGDEQTQTLSLSLLVGSEYKILVSKPYIWTLNINGTSSTYTTFTPVESTEATDNTIAITVSGGGTPNNFIMI